MEKIKDFRTQTYKYMSMYELMASFNEMAATGWSVVSISPVTLTATFKKDM